MRPRAIRVAALLTVIVALVSSNCRNASSDLTSAGSSSAVSAASSAIATCDTLAAHPEDPARKAAGVADDDLLPEAAIESCGLATLLEPSAGRLYFQLGRAYWADLEIDDAVIAFLKAQERGYAPAYYYLGLAYQQGLVEGEPPDAAAADQMFLAAAAEGFAPAVRAYEREEP